MQKIANNIVYIEGTLAIPLEKTLVGNKLKFKTDDFNLILENGLSSGEVAVLIFLEDQLKIFHEK
ncbi:MAG TPA: hypothetical protein VES38_09870 [Methylotenera sp.]|nr:hypothetical protein [Methylotenera sp.]